MLSKELEFTLNSAFRDARERQHEFMTVEHLLLALLDNPAAGKVLRACGVEIEKLRRALGRYLEEATPTLSSRDERETQPTLGFQRVLQRAVFHVQSSGKKEVTGANVLVAIFGERESQAVHFLKRQDVTRLDVVNYISHGSPRSTTTRRTTPSTPPARTRSRASRAGKARWRHTPPTSTDRHGSARSIPSSVAATRSSARCRYSAGAARTTRSSSAKRG